MAKRARDAVDDDSDGDSTSFTSVTSGDDDNDDDDDKEEEEEDAEISGDTLQELADGRGNPLYGRLQQLSARNRDLEAAILRMPEAIARGGQPPQRQEPAEPAAPTFDLKGKLRAQNKAILDGDEDGAVEIGMEIEAHRLQEATRIATRHATTAAVQASGAETQKTFNDRAAAAVFDDHPWLADDAINGDAVEEMEAWIAHCVAKGDKRDVAIDKAAKKILPRYAEELGFAGPSKKAPAVAPKPQAPKGPVGEDGRPRDPAKIRRNAEVATRIPGNINAAGMSTRQAASKLGKDISKMSDAEFEKNRKALGERFYKA